jgi:hypothetical protein
MNQDRDRMHENWSGFSGIEQEDAVIAVSMGPVVDRTKENLVAADQASFICAAASLIRSVVSRGAAIQESANFRSRARVRRPGRVERAWQWFCHCCAPVSKNGK